jgi:GLPGLI family protein
MKIKILLLSLLLANISIAQQKGIIYYGFVEAQQQGNAKGTDYNAYMVFNKDQSYYVTAKDSLEKAEKINEQKFHPNKEGGGGSINLGMKSSPQGDQVVYHVKKNTMWSNLLCKKQFYLKEEAPKMNWKIEKETKKIGKITCKKATVSFRGRNYTAWYSPEIAVPFGPWKLNGLPGLILEAYDTNKFVYWYFKTVEYPTKTKESVKYINLPTKMTFKGYEDYKRFQKEQQDKSIDTQRIVQKQFPDVIFVAPKISEMFIEFE